MPWYSQDRAKRLASQHARERREAVLRQKEAQRKHRETVEKRLERVQQTILRRRRDRQGTFRKGSAVLVKEPPKHEKTLNWKPETAWRPGPYPNPQKTSMARTRLFGPPPADSKRIFRDVVEALKSPTRPPRRSRPRRRAGARPGPPCASSCGRTRGVSNNDASGCGRRLGRCACVSGWHRRPSLLRPRSWSRPSPCPCRRPRRPEACGKGRARLVPNACEPLAAAGPRCPPRRTDHRRANLRHHRRPRRRPIRRPTRRRATS